MPRLIYLLIKRTEAKLYRIITSRLSKREREEGKDNQDLSPPPR